jgi:hypothetical protein
MATKRFDRRLHVLVSLEENEMLERLAKREGFTPSDAVRQLIRRRHAEVFGEQPAQPPKRKRSK